LNGTSIPLESIQQYQSVTDTAISVSTLKHRKKIKNLDEEKQRENRENSRCRILEQKIMRTEALYL
jgi:hypothetical protein